MRKEDIMHKKYGLWTAIGMVVGTVIGSGVFFKAKDVLINNDGNMLGSLLTVATVGLIMLVCAYSFSLVAARVEKVNGLVDYSELALGKDYAYYVGWFIVVIFNPTLTSCLAWISASYTLELFGAASVHWAYHYGLAALYLTLSCLFNVLAPVISGKFQVSTTFIKLVPLAVMMVAGIIAGLFGGTLGDNISAPDIPSTSANSGFLSAVVAFAFAFEGWIFATAINSELRDAKKNLPKALVIGSVVIIVAYIGYFLGIFGVLPTDKIVSSENIAKDAFTALFGSPVFGTIAYTFVVISCLGTMNGLMLATCRGMYSVAARDQGPSPEFFIHIDKTTDMPIRSSVFGFITTLIWLTQWQIGFINGRFPKLFAFENDELPIITFYAFCIPIFIYIIRKCDDLSPFKRYVVPSLAMLACVFMIVCAVYKYRIDALYYLIVFAILMLVGAALHRRDGKTLIKRAIEKIKK